MTDDEVLAREEALQREDESEESAAGDQPPASEEATTAEEKLVLGRFKTEEEAQQALDYLLQAKQEYDDLLQDAEIQAIQQRRQYEAEQFQTARQAKIAELQRLAAEGDSTRFLGGIHDMIQESIAQAIAPMAARIQHQDTMDRAVYVAQRVSEEIRAIPELTDVHDLADHIAVRAVGENRDPVQIINEIRAYRQPLQPAGPTAKDAKKKVRTLYATGSADDAGAPVKQPSADDDVEAAIKKTVKQLFG